MSERASTLAALAILAVAGIAAWMFQSRPPLTPEPASLASLPYVLGSYRDALATETSVQSGSV